MVEPPREYSDDDREQEHAPTTDDEPAESSSQDDGGDWSWEDDKAEDEPPKRESQSRYARQSAKLPRIGDSAQSSVLESMKGLRKGFKNDNDDD